MHMLKQQAQVDAQQLHRPVEASMRAPVQAHPASPRPQVLLPLLSLHPLFERATAYIRGGSPQRMAQWDMGPMRWGHAGGELRRLSSTHEVLVVEVSSGLRASGHQIAHMLRVAEVSSGEAGRRAGRWVSEQAGGLHAKAESRVHARCSWWRRAVGS